MAQTGIKPKSQLLWISLQERTRRETVFILLRSLPSLRTLLVLFQVISIHKYLLRSDRRTDKQSESANQCQSVGQSAKANLSHKQKFVTSQFEKTSLKWHTDGRWSCNQTRATKRNFYRKFSVLLQQAARMYVYACA